MYLNTSTNIANNALSLIPYDTIDYDPSGMITTGTSAHFTVPASGSYLIQGAWGGGASVSSGRAFTDVVRNTLTGYFGPGGTRVIDIQAQSAQAFVVGGSTILSLSGGDTISLWGYQITGGSVTMQGGISPYICHASIAFIAPT